MTGTGYVADDHVWVDQGENGGRTHPPCLEVFNSEVVPGPERPRNRSTLWKGTPEAGRGYVG